MVHLFYTNIVKYLVGKYLVMHSIVMYSISQYMCNLYVKEHFVMFSDLTTDLTTYTSIKVKLLHICCEGHRQQIGINFVNRITSDRLCWKFRTELRDSAYIEITCIVFFTNENTTCWSFDPFWFFYSAFTWASITNWTFF